MVNVFRKDMLVTSFLIALFIFIFGFYIGSMVDESRISNGEELLVITQLDTDSFLTEKEFMNTFEVQDCSLLNNRILELSNNLNEIGKVIEKYNVRKISNDKLYDQLKRKYFLLEIRAYTLRKQILGTCESDGSNIILFFYDTEENQESLNQGYALDSVVKNRGDVVIFSIDGGFDEPAVNSLKEYYNVESEPTIIINYETKKEGYINEEEITKLLK